MRAIVLAVFVIALGTASAIDLVRQRRAEMELSQADTEAEAVADVVEAEAETEVDAESDSEVNTMAGVSVGPNDVFIAAKDSDCRSPCPALNTLANHGLLPRDGRNIDYDQLKNALVNIYGLGPVFGRIFTDAAHKKFANPQTKKFSLCDLLINVHSTDQASKSSGIEHSASMSREDRPNMDFSHKADGTQRSPVQRQVDIVLHSSTDGKYITLPDIVRARQAIWAKSYAAQPAVKSDKLHTQEVLIANTEACLLLGALSGNSNQGKYQITANYAQSFLFHERFPVGWTKSQRALGLPQVIECLSLQGVEWAKGQLLATPALIARLFDQWFGFHF